ncbi:MAG: NPCBM/NEW2 domain-containing protein, partial [Armatimonadota bacterium]
MLYGIIFAMSLTSMASVVLGSEYISDKPEMIVSTQQSWGQLGYNVAAHNPGFEPLPLQVKDKKYEKGLGTHATGEIIVLLDGGYTKFESEVGVQMQNGVIGSVVFQVFVDGKLKYKSRLVTEKDNPNPINVSVTGATELKLVVTDGGNGMTCD